MKYRAAWKHRAPPRAAAWVAVSFLLWGSAAFAQKNKKAEEANARTVTGEVTSAEDTPVSGAVVQLKNTKTLQIRSFITKDDGMYYFTRLSPDIDYELRADSKGLSSPTKTLSSFDSRKTATINLKLKKK